LILAGRSQSKTQPVIDRIRGEGVPVVFLQLDLSSQKSVRGAAQSLKTDAKIIDVLINNAAVMMSPYGKTEDGIESQFATNHIGPWLFTNLLLQAGLIKERIVNVNSSASIRKSPYVLEPLDDLSYADGQKYDPVQGYSFSKMASYLCTRELAARLKPQDIAVFSLNPGSIRSPLQRYMDADLRTHAYELAARESYDFQPPKPKTLQEGASTTLRAALDSDLRPQSGAYLDDCQIVEVREHMDAYPAAARVWAVSESIVAQKFDILHL
jgi:NAD(P)-dependent dehydrogenase (short-subunit alcohol dehydrogenase family)